MLNRRSIRRAFSSTILLWFVIPTIVRAQESGREEALVEAFTGLCVQNIFAQERLEAAARELRWESLSRETLVAQNAVAGWTADVKGRRYLVLLNLGQDAGKQVFSCSLVANWSSRYRLDQAVRRNFTVVKSDAFTEAGQNLNSYSVRSRLSGDYLVFATSSNTSDGDFTTLALIARR